MADFISGYCQSSFKVSREFSFANTDWSDAYIQVLSSWSRMAVARGHVRLEL